MAEMFPEERLPTLTTTPSGVGWRASALAVAVVLVALVGLSRLGGSDRPTPTLAPSALAVAPTATPLPTPTTSSIVVGQLPGVISRSADGLTYVDGIPTGISGESVYRIRDVLLVPLGRTMLVGGWYLDQPCSTVRAALRCPSPWLSDAAEVDGPWGDVIPHSLLLDSKLTGTGAHIVLATVEADPACLTVRTRGCPPRLHVLQQIWSGP